MTVSADTIAILLASGVSADRLVDVVRSIEADHAPAEPRARTAGAIRQERYRDRQASLSDASDVTGDASRDVTHPSPSSPNDNNSNPHHPHSNNKPRAKSSLGETKSILETALSAETAAEIIAHRKAIKSPLTPGAARGLAKSFAAFGDAEAAARAMMANGWRGFDPAWMQRTASPRAGPGSTPRGQSMAEMSHMDQPDYHNDQRSDTGSGAVEIISPTDPGTSGFAGRLPLEASSYPGRRVVNF